MMRRVSVAMFLQVVAVGLWAGQGTVSVPTSGPLTVSGTIQISFPFAGEPIGVWSGGALVLVQDAQSETPIVHTSDRDGRGDLRFAFAIPESRRIETYKGRFARGFDGALALAGTAYTDDSRGANFIAWVSPDRRQQVVMRVSPFAPYAITVAGDGAIWAAGRELVEGKEQDPNHDIIRRYDKTGKVLGSFIPRSSLETGRGFSHPADDSQLVASKDRIGWYSDASRLYIEFSSEGALIGRFKTVDVDRKETRRLHGVALCDDGRLYVSAQFRGATRAVASWGIFSLDRDRGTWSFLPRGDGWGMLYGCDGSRLATTTFWPTLTWLEPGTK